jgi:putative membrane protein
MPSLRTFFRGLGAGVLMGAADIIPGVSGGTIALIVGVYERIIQALHASTSVASALAQGQWRVAQVHLRRMHLGLLLPLAAGILAAIVLGARILPPLLEAHPIPMRGLFLGLVGASLAIPALRLSAWTPRLVSVALAAAVVAFLLTGLPTADSASPSLPRVFATAAIAICAMIVPGVSGAFLLEVFGLYEPTLNAINTYDLAYLATFAMGAAVGLGGFARVLHYVLAHHYDTTMAVLIGLIAGALRALWPFLTPERGMRWPTSHDPVGLALGLALCGAAFIGLLIWWGYRRGAASTEMAESRTS